jgi:lipoate---protein ligase
MKSSFEFLHLKGWSIYEQLKLEEGLLRAASNNFFILSEGSTCPSIVMGISGKAEILIDQAARQRESLALIRRFSGGGTVVVDEQTLFVTFIANREVLKEHSFSPEGIMRWAETLLKPAFQLEGFHLKENDFVLGAKKCGGNAQYLQKQRFLIHTSFLWDYRKERMDALLHPAKTPIYRQGRSHEEFVCRLKDHFPSKELLLSNLRIEMGKLFALQPSDPARRLADLSSSAHRKATEHLSVQ